MMATGGRANLWLDPAGSAPIGRGDLHGKGEIIDDANLTVANGATVAVDAAGLLACTCVGQTDVIVDVTGYYL